MKRKVKKINRYVQNCFLVISTSGNFCSAEQSGQTVLKTFYYKSFNIWRRKIPTLFLISASFSICKHNRQSRILFQLKSKTYLFYNNFLPRSVCPRWDVIPWILPRQGLTRTYIHVGPTCMYCMYVVGYIVGSVYILIVQMWHPKVFPIDLLVPGEM